MHDKAAILPSYNREIPLLEEISLSRVFGNNDKMSHYISKEIIIVWRTACTANEDLLFPSITIHAQSTRILGVFP